jgi:hypothetical protein
MTAAKAPATLVIFLAFAMSALLGGVAQAQERAPGCVETPPFYDGPTAARCTSETQCVASRVPGIPPTCLTLRVQTFPMASLTSGLVPILCTAMLSYGDVPAPPPHGNIGVECRADVGGPTVGGGVGFAYAPGLVSPQRERICGRASTVLPAPLNSPTSIEISNVCTPVI